MMNMGARTALTLGIVVGMPFASYFVVFKPQNKEIHDRRERVQYREELLQKLREETSRNSDLARANEEIKKTVQSIEERLPNSKEMDGLVRQISDLAVQAGLEPPALKTAKPVQAALYMEQPVELEVTGNFVGFFTFLAHIEKLQRITRIPELKITATLDKDRGELKSEFTLSIYFQDDQKVAAGN